MTVFIYSTIDTEKNGRYVLDNVSTYGEFKNYMENFHNVTVDVPDTLKTIKVKGTNNKYIVADDSTEIPSQDFTFIMTPRKSSNGVIHSNYDEMHSNEIRQLATERGLNGGGPIYHVKNRLIADDKQRNIAVDSSHESANKINCVESTINLLILLKQAHENGADEFDLGDIVIKHFNKEVSDNYRSNEETEEEDMDPDELEAKREAERIQQNFR